MWELLYEEFWDKLEHFCYKLCRDDGRAEDLTQEVFLRALLDPDDAETPDETAEAALGTVDLDSLLGTLDPLDKMLFTLRYEEGYNASELGRKFELPPGTVRTRLGKVRHLLKQKLLEE